MFPLQSRTDRGISIVYRCATLNGRRGTNVNSLPVAQSNLPSIFLVSPASEKCFSISSLLTSLLNRTVTGVFPDMPYAWFGGEKDTTLRVSKSEHAPNRSVARIKTNIETNRTFILCLPCRIYFSSCVARHRFAGWPVPAPT